MSSTVLKELAQDPRLAYRLTVDDYHDMLKAGTLEDGAPFELLDGQIVRKIRNARGEDPMTIGTEHATVVTQLGDLNPKLKRCGCFIRIQNPVTIPLFNEPEPDGAIVRGPYKSYTKRHPGTEDILCVIEVSDASIGRDRGTKMRIYAENAIPVYVIINLTNRTVEVRRDPEKGRYGEPTILKPGQKLSLPTATGKPLIVPVKQLLP